MPAEKLDTFILTCLGSKKAVTCPTIADAWMEAEHIRYTEEHHHMFRNMVNRHMKMLARYGYVRYTGATVSSSDKSKIWELNE